MKVKAILVRRPSGMVYPFESSYEKATTLTSTLFITSNGFVIRLVEPHNDVFGRPHVQGGILNGLFQYLNHDVAQSTGPICHMRPLCAARAHLEIGSGRSSLEFIRHHGRKTGCAKFVRRIQANKAYVFKTQQFHLDYSRHSIVQVLNANKPYPIGKVQ